MFGINFYEFAIIGVVALVVLGPERLPKVARTAGLLFGRLQRYVANVKADINREMELSEFSKIKNEVTSAANSFQQSMNEQVNAIETEARAIHQTAAQSLVSADPTQAALVSPESAAEVASTSAAANLVATPILPANPAAQMIATTPAYSHFVNADANIQSFDFGIEPPRYLHPGVNA